MWKNRNVWIILIGEFIAGLGLWTGIIGNLEFMQALVPSDFAKSLILFAGLLAGVMVGPLAGKIIDSTSKKRVMLISGFGRMISVVFMFLAIEYQSILFMIIFMIAIQLSAAFYFPALQSSIPLIVKDKDLLQMNGVHMNVSTVSRIAGTALAGAMLVIMSLSSLYMASMVAYGILFLLTFLLNFEEPNQNDAEEGKNKKSGDFKEVLPVLKETPIALTVLILTFIPFLFIGGFNLMVINISEIQDDQAIKSWIYTIEGVCFMIGAFAVKRISNDKNMIPLMFLFVTLIAISHLSLYFADIKWMTLFSFGLFGLAVGCFFPIAATIFQTKIPKEYHGRFFSFRNMLDRVLFQIVLLGTGLFLDTIGLQMMAIVFGMLSLTLILIYGLRLFRHPVAVAEQKTP
ncbi:MFS transporter [Sutcliffiella horikoshii]|uniref:MFS transporter n=1 Tax=Sutcliffiella horikoshii TaxID=79883 RepID=A0A5D4SKJ4_9BACI|nr:MFS transporter [Sutcliffiella horikoshii]TYS63679.1 MFS transporter [Sutcliffiella horikoshii]